MLKLWIPCLPEHIWGEMTAKEASLTFQNDPPCIGSGPFQVVEWKRDDYLRMEANEDFYLGAPTIDEVMFVVYQNGDTMVQDLKSGDLDAAYLFPPAQYEELEATDGHRGDRVQLLQLGLRRVQLLRRRVRRQSRPARHRLPHRARVRDRPREDGRARLRRPRDTRLHLPAAGQLERSRLRLGAAGGRGAQLRPRHRRTRSSTTPATPTPTATASARARRQAHPAPPLGHPRRAGGASAPASSSPAGGRPSAWT